MNEQRMVWRRLDDVYKDCVAHEAIASRKCADAVVAHDTARLADPASPTYFATAKEAFKKWEDAEKEHQDANKRSLDAFANHLKAESEYYARRAELTRLMVEIEKFARESNPETIDKRLTEFVRWTNLLYEELKP